MSNANSYSSPTASKTRYVQPEPSPIEVSFWEEAKPLIPELEREVNIGRYRVDFLIPSKKVIIELYGYEWHNTKEKITKDKRRERELQRRGYQIISFTGTEVFKDSRACVNEVLEFLYNLSVEANKNAYIQPAPDHSQALYAPPSQPKVKAQPVPKYSPLPNSRTTSLSQRLAKNAQAAPSHPQAVPSRPQKAARRFGLTPQQLKIVVGILVFDLIIFVVGLAVVLQ